AFPDLVDTLEARGKQTQSDKVKRAHSLLTPIAVEQEKPLGLGHAVGLAEEVLSDGEDFFGVMLPDDIVLPNNAMEQMVAVRNKLGGSVLLAVEVPREQTFNYGVFDIEETDDNGVKKVVGMVEKPEPADAPSNLVATGRYVLDKKIFDALRRITPGKGGELQLTDAIELLIQEGEPVHVVVHQGTRHDLGNPGGYIPANVDFGLRSNTYGPALYAQLKKIIANYEAEKGFDSLLSNQ